MRIKILKWIDFFNTLLIACLCTVLPKCFLWGNIKMLTFSPVPSCSYCAFCMHQFYMKNMIYVVTTFWSILSIESSVWFKTAFTFWYTAYNVSVCLLRTQCKDMMINIIKINLPVLTPVCIYQPIWVSLLGCFSLGNSICHLLNAANVHGALTACIKSRCRLY